MQIKYFSLNFPENSDSCHEGYKNYLKGLEHVHGESESDDSGLSDNSNDSDSNLDDSDSESHKVSNPEDQEPKEPNLKDQDLVERVSEETVDDQNQKGNIKMLGLSLGTPRYLVTTANTGNGQKLHKSNVQLVQNLACANLFPKIKCRSIGDCC